tara:strand:- start:12 stop:1508 length:1497 start_codon:yes stop_codon:yes gene_type:complete
MNNKLFVILGNQLFDPKYLTKTGYKNIFMLEDYGLCTFQKHHKLKIYLYLTAMREYRDEIKEQGFDISYTQLEERKDRGSYTEFLISYLNKAGIKKIGFFEIEDKDFEKDFICSLKKNQIDFDIHQSPMFLFSRDEFAKLNTNKESFRMASFYQKGRKKFNILINKDGGPEGGKWSFDEENRKKIPKGLDLPQRLTFKNSKYHNKVCELINSNFKNHPGNLDNPWFPVKRSDAIIHLENFIERRLHNFGTYEDAMMKGENFLFHSFLSPLLNIGLLTPEFVIECVINKSKRKKIPLNSLEGFIRQLLGWREFIRGIYQEKGEFQIKQNLWRHKRKLSNSWYEGNTGIEPLDDCINGAIEYGYNHHIPRLMIISNIMNLCEIHPREIFKWFMEMYIDSSDWVMVPNVFGMATFADGGLMSTKPYTCASNYMLKMSNYKKGEWCHVIDGLYWSFIEKHRKFYSSNPRLSFQIRILDRLSDERKELIFKHSNNFIINNTKL